MMASFFFFFFFFVVVVAWILNSKSPCRSFAVVS